MRKTKSLQERFWVKVDVKESDECWEWTGGYSNSNGYGTIALGVRSKGNGRAHRVAWELTRGPIPAGMCVCHHCDNPGCVNPKHLFLGTQQDNLQDCRQKDRAASGSSAGEKNPKAKLSAAQVHAIRRRYAAGAVYQRVLASEYGITQAQVSAIVTRKNWRHL